MCRTEICISNTIKPPNIVKNSVGQPNMKWLTDITEFHIPAGKIYLSPIIDCFDGLPVSWTIGTSPDAELVNAMLDNAIGTLKEDEHPIVHSDRGAHYRWSGWIERMENAGLTKSMSRKWCSPDNFACEGFFGRLKMKCFMVAHEEMLLSRSLSRSLMKIYTGTPKKELSFPSEG